MRRMSERSAPTPRIITALASSISGAHALDGRAEADEDRLADQEVADVQLGELGDGGDGLHGLVVDAVAGVDLQAQAGGLGRRGLQAFEMAARVGAAPADRLAVGAGVQLDHLGAGGVEACTWARSASMKQETRMPASARRRTTGAMVLWPPATSSPPSVVRSSRRSGTRQAACGRWAGRWPPSRGHRHLEVERPAARGGRWRRGVDVGVGDVPAVFAQVGGDAVGAGGQRQSRAARTGSG
jgi:hypothetical protein